MSIKIYATQEYVDKAISNLPTSEEAVLYTEQNLTDEQKAQARANISEYNWRTFTHPFNLPVVHKYADRAGTINFEIADTIMNVTDGGDCTALEDLIDWLFYITISSADSNIINSIKNAAADLDALINGGAIIEKNNNTYVQYYYEDVNSIYTLHKEGNIYSLSISSTLSGHLTGVANYDSVNKTLTLNTLVPAGASSNLQEKGKYAISSVVGEALANKADVNHTHSDLEGQIAEKVASDTYDATSSKAMSGKAVAQALDTLAKVQPDWNQTDGQHPNYIRNKPFGYKDDIYANAALPFTKSEFSSIYIGKTSLEERDFFDFHEGDTLTIIWDGITYNLQAYPATIYQQNGQPLVVCYNFFGNADIWGEQYNAQNSQTQNIGDFYFIPSFGEFGTRSTASTHSVVLKDKTHIIKIDPKFLPDEALQSSIQPNWNQTDETALDFIQNKPNIPSIDGLATETYVNEKIDGLATETYVNEQIAALEIPEQAQQVQADWEETDTSSPAYIKNKPSISADGSLPVPQRAKVGQYLMVSGVDDEGAITSMTTVDTAASDWETMKNKPFGEHENIVELFPITRCENFILDSSMGMTVCRQGIDNSGCTLTIGKTYKVLWDGTEYACEAIDVSHLFSGLPVSGLGNGTAFNLPGNNEPFIVLCNNDNGYLTLVCLQHTEPCAHHDVGIYQEVGVKKIDKKYLPIPYFGEEKEIILETTFRDTKYDSDDDGIDDTWYNEGTIEDLSDSTLVVGENYTVIWNGVPYECECIEFYGMPCVGNTIVVDGEDTGEPFAIARSTSNDTPLGLIAWAAIFLNPIEDAIYDCIIMKNSITKIDSKYLPDDIGSGSGNSLPEVTADDAGKFLRVSSAGAWAVESIPNAEGASF